MMIPVRGPEGGLALGRLLGLPRDDGVKIVIGFAVCKITIAWALGITFLKRVE